MEFREFIGITENALSVKECKEIIDFFESNSDDHTPGVVSVRGKEEVKVDSSIKESVDLFRNFTEEEIPEKFIVKAMNTCMPQYEKKFNALKKVEMWDAHLNYNIRRYDPGMGYFAEHCEMHGLGNGCDRLMVWMVYLNDVEDGGETYFTSQDIKITPKAGSFIVWPAYWTHPHHGLVSNTQTKYIATGWFTFLPKQQLSAIKSRVAALKLIA